MKRFMSWFISSLVLIALAINFNGCGQSNIELVKSSTLKFNKLKTIGQAFDKYEYFKQTKWKEYKTQNGADVVEFNGVFKKEYYGGFADYKQLELIVKFLIHNDTLEIVSVEYKSLDDEGDDYIWKATSIPETINNLYNNDRLG